MSHVLTIQQGGDDHRVSAAAIAIAHVLGARVRTLAVDQASTSSVAAALDAAADTDIALVAVAAGPRTDDLSWRLAAETDCPVLAVPAAAEPIDRLIGSVLVPLDGSLESSRAVSETLATFAAAGIDVLLLHVFDSATVPQFWDHPEHADDVWRSEFAARHAATQGARVQWRSGAPVPNVLAAAEVEAADLIVLGWSRRLDAGRAATVRETVRGARVPVLLLPANHRLLTR